MNISHHVYELELEHAFTISRYSRNTQKTLIVAVEIDGHTGYGEATENPYYGTTIDTMVEQVVAIKADIEAMSGQALEEVLTVAHTRLANHPFALAALDIALHDAYARKAGVPLHQYWQLPVGQLPLSNYTIGIDTIPNMVAKIQQFPWPVYKIKLGTDHDIEIIQALRAVTDATFRVDANCAWTPEATLQYAHQLKELNVEFIEQPLPAADHEGMTYVYAHSVLPIIADESCQKEEDVQTCIGTFHGINIKLMKCGGYRPALNMIRQAKAHGLKIMVGCMTESTVGISAVAQLLPLLDYVDMDGALLLKDDVATGVRLDYGKPILPERPGTGAMLMA